MSAHRYSQPEVDALYRTVAERRDMRHFRREPVAPAVLERLLRAAHRPSVGDMQPWRFVRVRAKPLRERLHGLVEAERQRTAEALGERGSESMRLKVEGVRECGELLVVALCDGREHHVFGRHTMPEMDPASAACAIQNLWLTARAEGLGMGWCRCSNRPTWPRCSPCPGARGRSRSRARATSNASASSRCWNVNTGPSACRWSSWSAWTPGRRRVERQAHRGR